MKDLMKVCLLLLGMVIGGFVIAFLLTKFIVFPLSGIVATNIAIFKCILLQAAVTLILNALGAYFKDLKKKD